MDNYKQYHESFMQNHNGTTALETFAIIFPASLELLISVTIATLVFNNFVVSQKYKFFVQFLIDFGSIVIPIVLGMTVFSNYALQFILGLLVISILVILRYKRTSGYTDKQQIASTNRAFVTHSRATVNIISIAAILAVDFKIFPRRFAKTEQFGFSLMDVGVGLFVFINGIIAPEIRHKPEPFFKSCIGSIPLWVLGVARFFLTKEIDYQVHVSEYGVQWNFFLTLALTKIFSSLILGLVNVKHSLLISVALFTGYETLLELGLKSWVFSNEPRTSFLLANREGLTSSVGYIALYFLAVYIGQIISRTRTHNYSDLKLGSLLFLLSLTFVSLVYLLQQTAGVSRRLANTGYCLWIMFLGTIMTFLFLGCEHLCKYLYRITNQKQPIYVPFIYEAINYNGLAYFLLSNILTGLVNICIQTLNVGPILSLVIIVLYMFVNCGIICVLYLKKIKLKL